MKQNKIINYILFLILIISIHGCTKWNDLTSTSEGKIYMAKANIDRAKLKIYIADTPQLVNFGASIAGLKRAQENITVDFEVDNSLISKLNSDYAYLNYHFVAAPENSYSIETLSSIIQKGSSDSDPLQLQIFVKNIQADLQNDIDFCIPVKIKSVSSGSLDTIKSVAYFMIDSLYYGTTVKLNKTAWTITADSYEPTKQLPNGAPEKVIDNDDNTFWHTNHTTVKPGYPHWLAIDIKDTISLLAMVELTARSKYLTEDFTNFTVQGSLDGVTWSDYGTYVMADIAGPQQFYIKNPPRVRYVRIYMTSGPSYYTHLAELSLYKYN